MCITYSICAHTQQRAKCSSLESEEKKTDATTHFEFFFHQSSFRTKLAPLKQIRGRKERKKDGFFRFFCFRRVHSSALLNTRPRRRSQEPTERVDVCFVSSAKTTPFSLFTRILLHYLSSVYYYYIRVIYSTEREGERDTRLTQCWAFLGGGREQQQHPRTR